MGLISWRKDGWTEHIRFEICIEKWSICFASLFETICDGVLRQVNWNQLFKSCLKIYLFLYWYHLFDWLFFLFTTHLSDYIEILLYVNEAILTNSDAELGGWGQGAPPQKNSKIPYGLVIFMLFFFYIASQEILTFT